MSVLQHIVDGGVHQAMARDRGDAAERLGHDGDAEMAVAAGRPGMAGVQVALVLDGQQRRREAAFQPLAQPLLSSRESCGQRLLRWGGFGFARQPEDLRHHENEQCHR